MFLKMFSDKDESAVAQDLYTLGGQNHISHADRDRKEIKQSTRGCDASQHFYSASLFRCINHQLIDMVWL